MNNFELLENEGFIEFKSVQVPFPWWIKVGARMAFSFAAVEDADFEWLSDRSRSSAEGDEFLFYFAYGESTDLELCNTILRQHAIEGVAQTAQLVVPAK
jgi:hypothetical protein